MLEVLCGLIIGIAMGWIIGLLSDNGSTREKMLRLEARVAHMESGKLSHRIYRQRQEIKRLKEFAPKKEKLQMRESAPLN